MDPRRVRHRQDVRDARYLCAKARERRFATSEVQISINDTPLHHLETVYRRLIERLETAADGPNAFQAIVDGWLYQVGDEVTRLRGIAEDDPGFADATEQRLEDKLADLSKRNPAFAQVLRAYHRATHEGDFATAQGLLAWLAGQPHTDRHVLKAAGTRGKVDGQASLTFLAGLLQLLRQSGYAGLVVVLDEVETVQRMNAQTREKSLNALRQLMDMLAKEELPGLYLVVTGTRDFFEGYKGLKALAPLYQRVQVNFSDDAALRQPEGAAGPADAVHRRATAHGRHAHPEPLPGEEPRARSPRASTMRFLHALVAQVTDGLRRQGGARAAPLPARADRRDGPRRHPRGLRSQRRTTSSSSTTASSRRRSWRPGTGAPPTSPRRKQRRTATRTRSRRRRRSRRRLDG